MSRLARRPWHEIPVAEWDRVMAVNLRGMFLLSEASPFMSGQTLEVDRGKFFHGTRYGKFSCKQVD